VSGWRNDGWRYGGAWVHFLSDPRWRIKTLM
jgi:hypothetical protein